jgi:hypothetical protein
MMMDNVTIGENMMMGPQSFPLTIFFLNLKMLSWDEC